jgi:hypothetical protein
MEAIYREFIMSAVIAAVFADHDQAVLVRTQFVKEGFPTDRTHLTSREELGQAAVRARESVSVQLVQHFRQLFSKERTAQELSSAVVGGRAVIVVQPRGEAEINRTFELFRHFGPSNLRHRDLDNQFMQHAAAAQLRNS